MLKTANDLNDIVLELGTAKNLLVMLHEAVFEGEECAFGSAEERLSALILYQNLPIYKSLLDVTFDVLNREISEIQKISDGIMNQKGVA